MPVNGQVAKAYLLSRPDETLKVESDANGIRVTVPKEKPDPIASVVVLDIEGAKVTSFLGPAADGSIHLAATDAEIMGSHLAVEGSDPANLGYWIDANDYATWTFRVEKAGAYTPELMYSAQPGSGGSQIELSVRRPEIFGEDCPNQELGRLQAAYAIGIEPQGRQCNDHAQGDENARRCRDEPSVDHSETDEVGFVAGSTTGRLAVACRR